MNTTSLKAYAPEARLAFMQAIRNKMKKLGLSDNPEQDHARAYGEGDYLLIEGQNFPRHIESQRNRLIQRIEDIGYAALVNEAAFTWFNRFTALRYMEVNGFLSHGLRVLSRTECASFDQGLEILEHANEVIDDLHLDRDSIIDLVLAGNQRETLYRTLLLAQCHKLHQALPLVFAAQGDALDLLLPEQLTQTHSILKDLIDTIDESLWRNSDTGEGGIEVIGWLYQFYISEEKDRVIGKVVAREDIPAATQLFTPNWIVQYLVHNSLGRQWLATYPDSPLQDSMTYYIKPAEQSDEVLAQLKAITPTSLDPETIKVLDPACGSGHILVEVYKVLRDIYLECGYLRSQIPELILSKNIFGLDIDDRAAQLASFALLMKAREDNPRLFSAGQTVPQLNIYALQSTEQLDVAKVWRNLDLDNQAQTGAMVDLFAQTSQQEELIASATHQPYLDLLYVLKEQCIDAKNLGSLIEIDPQHHACLQAFQALLVERQAHPHAPIREAVQTLLPLVNQALLLSQTYDVVVANPPYMGNKGMNKEVKVFAQKHYPNSKSDLFAMFMERGFKLLHEQGYNAQVTMQSWMFLSSYEKMRTHLLDQTTLETMLHMGNGVMKIAFGTSATVFRKLKLDSYQSSFSYCTIEDLNQQGIPNSFPVQNERLSQAQPDDFKKIPGSPIAYWLPQAALDVFKQADPIREKVQACVGLQTGNNDLFLRLWQEISLDKLELNCDDVTRSHIHQKKWFPYNKGGAFKRWYGNQDYVVNWEHDGFEIKNCKDEKGKQRSRPQNTQYYFKPQISWSDVTSSKLSFRYYPAGHMLDAACNAAFYDRPSVKYQVLSLGNSALVEYYAPILNPTMHFKVGNFNSIPAAFRDDAELEQDIQQLIDMAQQDECSFEDSYHFQQHPLLTLEQDSLNIQQAFSAYRELCDARTVCMQQLEEKNNQLIIDKSGLNEMLQSQVDLEEISLHSNPHFAFRQKDISARAHLFQSQTLVNLLSYTVGCMMGRYSLDREGLVYAHAGNEGFQDLVEEGAYATFAADADGILPLGVEEWMFEVDATTRLQDFVATVWGKEQLQDNLAFIADSLCLDAIKPQAGEHPIQTIRRYFATQFFKDHLKTYKKRPIYWLFSSGKEKAFECLVYLHRYNPATLARMRTQYVLPLLGQYENQIMLKRDLCGDDAPTVEKKRLEKEVKSLDKKVLELRQFDEKLKTLSEQKIELDLDDGVKVNYGKFGDVLAEVKQVHGQKPKS